MNRPGAGRRDDRWARGDGREAGWIVPAAGVSGSKPSGRATGGSVSGPGSVRGAEERFRDAVMSPAGASVRTMWPIGPEKDGFCQVASPPLKSVARTSGVLADVSGIGGAEAQARMGDGPGLGGFADPASR